MCAHIYVNLQLTLDTATAFSPQSYHENPLLCIDPSVFLIAIEDDMLEIYLKDTEKSPRVLLQTTV